MTKAEGQTRAELIFAGGTWRSCQRTDPPLPSRLCKKLRRARGYGVAGAPREDAGKFLFSLRGVGPPRPRRGSFHEANGGDEGVENARVLPGAGSIAQGLVKGVRVPANQFLRLFDPDRAQIAGDRCADVGDCFEDCGQSRMGRLACAFHWPHVTRHSSHVTFFYRRVAPQ
jgi:hypothetical protein